MFPDFNIFSSPLLILLLQGLILVGMLFNKARSKKDLSSFILAVLLLLTCYDRTAYTIGFMGWYDTFRNTKINYFMISTALSIGPLIYYYIKSVGQKDFRFDKKVWVHFVPMALFALFSFFVLIYDFNQPDFELTQNGVLLQWVLENISVLLTVLFAIHLMIYLLLSFQFYYKIRSKLEHQFSDTYKFELRWIRNFLFLFTFLFLYSSMQLVTDEFIFDLHWTQEWWLEFFSLLVVIYVGVKGFFTPLDHLPLLEPELLYQDKSSTSSENNETPDYQQQMESIVRLVEKESLYLDPNITLTSLAKQAKVAPSNLSLIINKGSGQNFNEFINSYRVASVKEKLMDKENDHLSILSIALDTGFNSKATFNRVFKKIDGHSPSFYRN